MVLMTGRAVKYIFRNVPDLRRVSPCCIFFGIQIVLGGAAYWAVLKAGDNFQPTALRIAHSGACSWRRAFAGRFGIADPFVFPSDLSGLVCSRFIGRPSGGAHNRGLITGPKAEENRAYERDSRRSNRRREVLGLRGCSPSRTLLFWS